MRKNDINILDYVLQPMIFIHFFKENRLMLSKILKLSLKSLPGSKFLEKLVSSDECDIKICSTLLISVDDLRKKNTSDDCRNALLDLSLKLSEKIIQKYDHVVEDPDEIAGLRISLKMILSKEIEVKDDLIEYVKSLVKSVVLNVDNVSDENLIHEMLQLSLIILKNRTIFNIDQDLVEKLCVAVTKDADNEVFTQFFEILNNNEFHYLLNVIQNQTVRQIEKKKKVFVYYH